MPYVEATTLESLRMFMGRGFAVPHRAVKDTTLGGYFIPKVRNLAKNKSSQESTEVDNTQRYHLNIYE